MQRHSSWSFYNKTLSLATLVLYTYCTNLLSVQPYRTDCAITIRANNPGRLGNQVLPYVKARWISHTFRMPYLHRKFVDQELFVLSEQETPAPPAVFKQFSRTVEIKSIAELERDLVRKGKARTLYVVNLLSTPHRRNGSRAQYHPEFIDEMRKLLAPRKPTTAMLPKLKNEQWVGLHIRTGGSAAHIYNPKTKKFETRDASTIKPHEQRYILDKDHRNNYPTKFLPMAFYVHQLKRLAALCKGEKLRVRLFTDDNNPQRICSELKKLIGNLGIPFECRAHNSHDQNVMEDIILMSQCDYLIRSESTITIMAEWLGDPKIVISPRIVSRGKPPVDDACVTRHIVGATRTFASKYL